MSIDTYVKWFSFFKNFLLGCWYGKRPRIAQKLVPNLEINRYVTFSFFYITRSCSLTSSNNKIMINILLKNSDPHIYFDLLFVKFEKIYDPTLILTPTFIRYLRVFTIIISLGVFFSFFKNFDFLGQKWGKGTKMAQNWQKACQHSIWGTTRDMIVSFSRFLIFSIFGMF